MTSGLLIGIPPRSWPACAIRWDPGIRARSRYALKSSVLPVERFRPRLFAMGCSERGLAKRYLLKHICRQKRSGPDGGLVSIGRRPGTRSVWAAAFLLSRGVL